MHIGHGLQEVEAQAVHEVCLCFHLGKNEQNKGGNWDET